MAAKSIDDQIAEAVEAQQALMADEAKVAGPFKAKKQAIQAKIDGLQAQRAVASSMEGLSPTAQRQVLEALSAAIPEDDDDTEEEAEA